MITITKESKKYNKIVIVHSKDCYEIIKDLLEPGERVVCPNDKDMFVSKGEDGQITLIKNCYSKNPFS